VFAFVNDWIGGRGVAASRVEGDGSWGRTGASAGLDGVSYLFGSGNGDVTAVEGVTLHIRAGEFVCIVGPSGSGKSTLLNLLAGLLHPTAGRVSCDGRPVRGPAPERAVVFQDAALFPWLTLRQNVEFALGVKGVAKRERHARSETLLRGVHLWRFAGAYPHELSGGMRQRGAIARALAADPAILLMDEPFAAVDAQTREILHEDLVRIWTATRKTIVFVTHDVREAVRLADRVIVMETRPGRIAEELRIDVPRPRLAEDAGVSVLVDVVAGRIAGEVGKVSREEAEHAGSSSRLDSRRDPRPSLAGGL
jgi:NitT/TauT family transport system ATP-binding protein